MISYNLISLTSLSVPRAQCGQIATGSDIHGCSRQTLCASNESAGPLRNEFAGRLMRHLSLAFIAAVSTVALTQIAAAADLPRKAPAYTPPPPVPVFSWTGFYVGVNGGYGWHAGDSDVTAVNVEISEALTAHRSAHSKSQGWFGGGQIGYNWQFAPQWVAGIEADIQGANINGSATAFAPNPVFGDPNDPNANVNAYAKTKLDWFGTIRARLGYTLFDRTLIYATGGFAFGGVKDALSVTELSEGTLFSGAATHDKTATGYVLGGGLNTL